MNFSLDHGEYESAGSGSASYGGRAPFVPPSTPAPPHLFRRFGSRPTSTAQGHSPPPPQQSYHILSPTSAAGEDLAVAEKGQDSYVPTSACDTQTYPEYPAISSAALTPSPQHHLRSSGVGAGTSTGVGIDLGLGVATGAWVCAPYTQLSHDGQTAVLYSGEESAPGDRRRTLRDLKRAAFRMAEAEEGGIDPCSALGRCDAPAATAGSTSISINTSSSRAVRRSGARDRRQTAMLGSLGAYLSSARAAACTDLVSMSPPSRRPAQIRVVELFQFWLTSSGVRRRVERLARTAVAEAGLALTSAGTRGRRRGKVESPELTTTLREGSVPRKGGGLSVGRVEGEEQAPGSARQGSEGDPAPVGTSSGTVVVRSAWGATKADTDAASKPTGSNSIYRSEGGGGVENSQPVEAGPPPPIPPSPRGTASTPMCVRHDGSSGPQYDSATPHHPDNDSSRIGVGEKEGGGVLTVAAAVVGAHSSTSLTSPSKAGAAGTPTATRAADPPAGPAAEPSVGSSPTPAHTPSQATSATVPSRGASYDEIPRFYFPLGKPTTRERVLSGPLERRRMENPHLTVAAGVTLPGTVLDGNEVTHGTGEAAASALAGTGGSGKGKAAFGGSTALSSLSPDGAGERGGEGHTRLAPTSVLRSLDDKHVHAYITKEFSRVPAGPRVGSVSGGQHYNSSANRVRLLSGSGSGLGAGGSRLRSSGPAALAKQEASHRHHIQLCMQRICVNGLGIPKYFAFLLIQLIELEAGRGAMSVANKSGSAAGRPGSSSSSSIMNSLLNGNADNPGGSVSGSGSGNHQPGPVTAVHVCAFYDKYLKGKDSLRRTFDLLILSSSIPLACNPSGAVPTAVTPQAERCFTYQSTAPTVGPAHGQLRQGGAPARVAGAGVSHAGWGNEGSRECGGGDVVLLRSSLLHEDFVAYVNVVLRHHPGLTFLSETPDFQAKYLDTVVCRIFYELDRLDRGTISFPEFCTSRLFDAFRQVDATDDINAVLLFFSYEHFYVLYCRFWELDEDRDMLLSRRDLSRYQPEDIMNPLIVDRIFQGVGRPVCCTVPNMIGYEDFIWFCLSEEDKSTPRAIRYWFRILDVDGDGILSVYELQTFYNATRNKIEQYVADSATAFNDVVCQVFDMLRCDPHPGLLLKDLLREPEAAAVALNMLTNVVRFLQYEQRDPFVAHQERLLGGQEQSAWDRFARAEYDRMSQEVEE